jgi:hypothetical protein
MLTSLNRLWCAGCALGICAQLLFLKCQPFALLEPGGTVVHLLAYASLALMLWIAFDGRQPVLAVGGAMLLAAIEAPAAPDFLADAAAAIATGAALLWFGEKKPCAESSPRSREGT